MKVIRFILTAVIAIVAVQALVWVLLWVLAVRCDTGWVGPTKEPGPLPLSSSNAPIIRLVKTRTTFETTLKEVLWDEGNGAVPVTQRIKPVVYAVPKELLGHLDSTRTVPSPNGNGRFDQPIYDAFGVMVSLNPDALIVTVRERSQGSYDYLFQDWSIPPNAVRSGYIRQRLECFNYIVPDRRMPINAGTLVPWSDEMYVVSTDPKIKCVRLKFEKDQAMVVLPDGKLLFRHHEDDVDVSREYAYPTLQPNSVMR